MTARTARDVLADIAARQQKSQARAKALGARRQWFRIENATTDEQTQKSRAKVYLYEPIGGWYGVTPASFVEAITDLDVDEIELHINSPGGSVYDGITIMNVLRQHEARVIGVVDGLAASAASFIAVGGCDELIMADHSELMVHDAWGLCIGNAEDMNTMAADLDRISDNIASVYARKASGSTESWRDIMRAETWYSAQEAVTAGLADRVGFDDDSDDDDQSVVPETDDPVEDRWDRAIFASAGRPTHTLPSASAARVTSPAAPASGDTTTQEGADVVFNDSQLSTLRQSLGVADDADGDTIVAALGEALQEQAEEQPAASTRVPEGMALVDATTLAALRDDAAAGREARNQQQAEARRSLVQAAVRDGRIAPSRAQAWENRIAADPEEATTLASLAKGLVPLDEHGHAGEGPQSTDSTDDLYAAAWGAPTDQTQEA